MKQPTSVKEAKSMVKERWLDHRVEKLAKENDELREAVDELALLARRDGGQVHDARNDLPRYQRVVVVERALVALPQPALDGVGKRQRRGAGGAREHAADRPGKSHARPSLDENDQPHIIRFG